MDSTNIGHVSLNDIDPRIASALGVTLAKKKTKAQALEEERVAAQEKREQVEARNIANKFDSIQGFRRMLLHRYGSMINAWKHLDADNNGRLSYSEFCKACRDVGYFSNLRKLWNALDDDRTGFITLNELDFANNAVLLEQFVRILVQRYKTIGKAWLQGFGAKSSRISKVEFTETCKQKLKLHEGVANKVAGILDYDASDFITKQKWVECWCNEFICSCLIEPRPDSYESLPFEKLDTGRSKTAMPSNNLLMAQK